VVFITETGYLLRGTDWVFKSGSNTFVLKRLTSSLTYSFFINLFSVTL